MFFPTISRIITQFFGENPSIYAQFGFPGHNGIDIAGKYGDPIYAFDEGTLNIQKPDPQGYGVHCTIVHKNNLTSYYCHLLAIYPKDKSIIKQGELIGAMGSSGFSTGIHLHFGIRRTPYNKNDYYKGFIDPLSMLNNENSSDVSNSKKTESETKTSINEPNIINKNGKATITISCLNIRNLPNINGVIIGQLFSPAEINYEAVYIYEKTNLWQDIWLRFAGTLYIAVIYQGVTYAQLDEHIF